MMVREMMFGSGTPFPYFECGACGSVQVVTVLEGAAMAEHYPSDFYAHQPLGGGGLRDWLRVQRDRQTLQGGSSLLGSQLCRLFPSRDVIGIISRLGAKPDWRILDVGCGNGALLDRLARAGFSRAEGVDPFIAGNSTTPGGARLHKAALHDMEGGYRLIMFNHSLEHVPDFLDGLRAARDRLAPGGSCLVRLPTCSSEAYAIYGVDWVQLDAPRHIVIPSRDGMRIAAEQCGFRLESSEDDSAGFQFWGSELIRKDIAHVEGPHQIVNGTKPFTDAELKEFERRAVELNARNLGDRVAFVLRAA